MTTASPALTGAVELLERALGYTRVALADVGPQNLGAPTPCAGWTLARLLAHMEDALDAFTEAAAGQVQVVHPPATDNRVEALREKACALLGAWAAARPVAVTVGDRQLDAPLLVGAAAMEVAVHGWDVAQATGRRTPLPDDLARGLHPVAARTVAPRDRGTAFGPALVPARPDSPGDVLMAYLGRMTGPVGWNHREPPAPNEIAS